MIYISNFVHILTCFICLNNITHLFELLTALHLTCRIVARIGSSVLLSRFVYKGKMFLNTRVISHLIIFRTSSETRANLVILVNFVVELTVLMRFHNKSFGMAHSHLLRGITVPIKNIGITI